MDQVQDVVLDVFKRQFFTDAGRPVRAHQASHFSVQIRYLKQQEAAVLKCSGVAGMYIEPRLPDSSMPSDEYQVVWMPQVSFTEAQHAMQCEPLSIASDLQDQADGMVSGSMQSTTRQFLPI